MTFTSVASVGVLTRGVWPTHAFLTLVYVCKTEQPCSLLLFEWHECRHWFM